jgi:hypothetical protein
MEGTLTQGLGWKLMPCTAYSFVSCFLQRLVKLRLPATTTRTWMECSKVPHALMNRVMEVVDLVMLDADSLCFRPSYIAASVRFYLWIFCDNMFCEFSVCVCVLTYTFMW